MMRVFFLESLVLRCCFDSGSLQWFLANRTPVASSGERCVDCICLHHGFPGPKHRTIARPPGAIFAPRTLNLAWRSCAVVTMLSLD